MKTMIYFFATLFLLNCSKEKSYDANANLVNILEESAPAKQEDKITNSATTTVSKEFIEKTNPEIQKNSFAKKIIKNGDMIIEVSDVKTAQEKIRKSVKNNKGYIQNERFSNTETETTVSMEIRIPNQYFDSLINSFSEGIGSISDKNIRVQDVTEEYTDVSIRLKNKLAYLEKYRDLLKRSASTKDLLEIQEKIRGLEEEIESSEGRLRYIDDQVNYSTLNLTLTKEKPRNTVTSKIGFGGRFIDSFASGWNIFVNFILAVVSLWPFLFIIPVFIYLVKKWKKSKTKKD